MKRRLDIKLDYASDAGDILAKYLNDDYDIIYIKRNDDYNPDEDDYNPDEDDYNPDEDDPKDEFYEFDAHFIWESKDWYKGYLTLWTNWFNIGELWQKKIDFQDYAIGEDWDEHGKISSKDIIELEKEIIEELEKYNDELIRYDSEIFIKKR